jgi:DNA-directed RNA polymerase specialized sigma24 family protein
MTDDPFVSHRSLLFTVAYEMLGSAADADDVLQEAWLRWGSTRSWSVGGAVKIARHRPSRTLYELRGALGAE